MVLLNMKNSNSASSSSPLNLSGAEEKPAISFSDLLKGAGKTKDAKVVQNGSLVLSLASEEKSIKTQKTSSKAETLVSLLKSEEKTAPKKSEEPLELNPKIAAVMTKEEIKELVSEAKNYLKSKIQESEGYKKAEIKELPTTLKGLVEAAKKFDIDISKITLEEVRLSAKEKPQRPEHDIKAEMPKETLQEKKEPKAEILKGVIQEKIELKAEAPKEAVLEKKEPRAEISREALKEKQEFKAEVLKETTQEKKELKPEIPQEKRSQVQEMQPKQKQTAANSEMVSKMQQNETRNDEKSSEVSKELKGTPLFKAQTVIEHTTTEQIVQAKVNSSALKAEQKTPKERSDETLKLLLRGEKASSESSLTSDFSVSSAKVIASGTTQESTKTLERLLQGEALVPEQSTSSAKPEAIATHKSESLEVKMNEAKQMIKYLSNDIKSAIDDYRSPFTRVKVQLNPQNLGEVDLTVIQRGKNLHVNISSNNSALNTLSMNINELKVQLNNNGINNATFNFNSGSQSGDQSSNASQQQRQNEQKAHEEYSYFENEEANEEILSSLEIIVPRYI